ncbi:(Fe-S)-binding protein [Flavobacterium difficile]|uniref:(Fe-S)-binding protein n=1 Tax=Flavobacterium difficile TaxID=2709659 RepID=A0ABX0I9D5_9FLAO|nr:(Fe-S)-binding protein [Flavobacterium difficile]NHM02056.1 (Fe-S)-binding protein [Flavobacterium difficile]
MSFLPNIIFAIVLIVGVGFFAKNVKKIIRNIKLGQKVNRTDHSSARWKNMALIAFGQKKMFTRPIPAILHFTLYAAFIITQIELLEIIVDGLFGTHRFFKDSLGGFYTFLISFIEILSLLALIATIAFLSRRNLLKLPRFNKVEMLGWPTKDANLILIMEVVLVACIFTMNGTDEVLYSLGKSHYVGDSASFNFTITQHLGPALFGGMSESALHVLERVGWWGHFLMVIAFLNYLYFSKHLHILLAFPNTYFADLNAKGKFDNLESVTNEVKLMMDPNADPFAAPANPDAVPAKFGASDVQDLNWVQLLNAYTCTECGRCTSSCPANTTGKKLSPRKIMMDTRDRLEEVGKNMDANNGVFVPDNKSLLNDYITPEELWACTSCNACVEECPINISPLSIIMDMRRYLVMEQSAAPMELNAVMTNIENNGAPWQYNQQDRVNWRNEA